MSTIESKYVNIFQCARRTVFNQLRKSSNLVSVRSDFKDISNCSKMLTSAFFFNFLVGNNHMNLCTKYNVYIVFPNVGFALGLNKYVLSYRPIEEFYL